MKFHQFVEINLAMSQFFCKPLCCGSESDLISGKILKSKTQ